MDAEHQGERDDQDQQTREQRRNVVDQEAAHFGGVADPCIQFTGAAPREEGAGQPEQVVEVLQDQMAVESDAQSQGIENAAVAYHNGASHYAQHQQCELGQCAAVGGRKHLVDDVLEEKGGADAGNDVDQRSAQHQQEVFP